MMANTPKPPYYAVIFTSLLKTDHTGYAEMAAKMEELAQLQPGYLGFESARGDIGISVSYWKDLESIRNWKKNTDHILAQKLGQTRWYESYKIRISKVEREYGFNNSVKK